MARKRVVRPPKAANEGMYKTLCDCKVGGGKDDEAIVERGETVKLSAEDAATLLAQGAVEAV